MTSIAKIQIKSDDNFINPEVVTVIRNITSRIPKNLHGQDRVSSLKEIITSIPIREKDMLVELFNGLLSEMVRREASDIELGGYGSNNFVWFRVFGKKNPIEELPRLNNDEALLILSILSEANVLEKEGI
jgi:twitching motility protein PilT